MKMKGKIKKKLLLPILTGCMTVSVIPPMIAIADNDAPLVQENGAMVQIEGKNAQSGMSYYKINDGEWIELNESKTYDIDNIAVGDVVYIRAIPNQDWEIDTTGTQLAVDGKSEAIDYNAMQSENGWSFTYAEGKKYQVCIEYRNGGQNKPDDSEEKKSDHDGYDGERVQSTVTVNGKADYYINDSEMHNAYNEENQVEYTYTGDGTVDFYVTCFVNERITELKINGVDYYDKLPTPDTPEGRAELLEACKGQINEFKITVPYSESYTIDSSVKGLDDTDEDYMVVGNFLWTYSDENQVDDYLDHGRMELIGVNYNGKDYSPDELNNPGTGFDWSEKEDNGSAVLPVGSVVTVKLVPEYGYQLTSFGINGGSFGTGDEQSVFTFEIKRGNAHLGAHFTPVEDEVISNTDIITDGSIELGGSLSGGTAQLKINDADLTDEKKDEFLEETPSGYTVADYVDLDMYNVYYKANADDVWEQAVDTLEDDVTISVQLADSEIDPANLVIVHNIHNGDEFETIPVDSYDEDTNTITFKADSFSTYAIATKDEADTPKGSDDTQTDKKSGTNTNSPQTGDSVSVVPWVATLIVEGSVVTAIAIIKKKKVQD